MRLTHLRWTTGVMSPGAYGRMKPVEPPVPAAPPREQRIVYRHFEVEVREDGAKRVVAYRPNPSTGLVEREPEEKPWTLPRPEPGVRELSEPVNPDGGYSRPGRYGAG